MLRRGMTGCSRSQWEFENDGSGCPRLAGLWSMPESSNRRFSRMHSDRG